MQTKLSTKGQVVLPGPIRRKLGLRPGDALDAKVESGRVVLTPKTTRAPKAVIVIDEISGLPVLSCDADAPALTSKHVREILADFP
jgi:AbrB family looped-hinge helix DNA binding protein